MSAAGLDLREATQKTLYAGAFYNHALAIAGGPITEATIDRLVVSFGATPKLAGSTDPDASADVKDELIAEYASNRDDKTSSTLGPYRKIRGALLVMKAAAAGGEKCRADLDAALGVYFLEWEKATYLTVITFLNQAATDAQAMPVRGRRRCRRTRRRRASSRSSVASRRTAGRSTTRRSDALPPARRRAEPLPAADAHVGPRGAFNTAFAGRRSDLRTDADELETRRRSTDRGAVLAVPRALCSKTCSGWIRSRRSSAAWAVSRG